MIILLIKLSSALCKTFDSYYVLTKILVTRRSGVYLGDAGGRGTFLLGQQPIQII